MKLHKLKISRKVFETKDSVSLQLEVPGELKEEFKYKQGQFLAMQFNINGESFRREYSICSSPYTNEPLTISAKKVEGGTVSKYIYDTLKEGDEIESFPPQGKFFTELNPESEKNYLLIGGGSGITPLVSIAKSVLLAEPNSKATLYYGNYDEGSIIFRSQLEELEKNYPDRYKNYFTIESTEEDWNGLKGLINKNDLHNIIDENFNGYENNTEYFICGPVPMMELAKQVLTEKGIANDKIHIEYFTAPVVSIAEDVGVTDDGEVEAEVNLYADEDEETSEGRTVKIKLDHEESTVPVNPGQNILDAAMDAGLDPPYSCRSGICTTCRAMLLSGKVHMDEREGLSDSEIEEGFILTCQSHPLTDDVSIEYD